MPEEYEPPVPGTRYVPAGAEFLGLHRPHRSRDHVEWRPGLATAGGQKCQCHAAVDGLQFGDSLPWN